MANRREDGTLTIQGAEISEAQWDERGDGWRAERLHSYEASIEVAAWEAVRLLSAIVDRLDKAAEVRDGE